MWFLIKITIISLWSTDVIINKSQHSACINLLELNFKIHWIHNLSEWKSRILFLTRHLNFLARGNQRGSLNSRRSVKNTFWMTPIWSHIFVAIAHFAPRLGAPKWGFPAAVARVHSRARFACAARWKKETNWGEQRKARAGLKLGERAAFGRRTDQGPTPGRRFSLLQMAWIWCARAMMTNGTATLVSDIYFSPAARVTHFHLRAKFVVRPARALHVCPDGLFLTHWLSDKIFSHLS